jgi:formylglycine-generating enzyme required for sulfatase activity
MMDFARTGPRPHLGRAIFVGLFLVLTPPLTPHALAQTPPNYGYEWATIESPGNRFANPQEAPRNFPPFSAPVHVGGVRNTFRIATTEVTVGQWLEFVQSYYPFHDDPRGGRIQSEFTGLWVFARNRNLALPPEFYVAPGSENYPTNMGWRFAARYVNWLHNGKVNEKWAFEGGVYDTTTFTLNPNGTFNDQRSRNLDATFWIPSRDELTKAFYYDPDRYGPGEEGYWLYPDGSNTELVGGPPGSPGAQTNAGRWGDPFESYDVGSYPDTTTPWGLLDASGGMREWTEEFDPSPFGPRNRTTLGSSRYGLLTLDRLDNASSGRATNPGFRGIRIASAVPTPATFVVLGSASLFLVSRRRRK